MNRGPNWKLQAGMRWLVLATLGLSFTALARADAPRASGTDFTAVDRFVKQEMQASGLPGLALGIVQGDQIVHLNGFGVADQSKHAVTPQTPFIIGSVSKSFTALAIMQLVEAGAIELDSPVQRYLPWFRVADADASARITVRHLLNQTSGLPTIAGIGYLVEANARDDALEQAVRAMQSVALTYPPGQTYQYCNLNYTTLGLLVQTVSGETYEQYVQQHILTPLGMQNSFASPPDALRNGLATGYEFWYRRAVPIELTYNRAAVPAGYISASAEDMARYLIAFLNGGRVGSAAILSPAGIAELQRPAVAAADAYAFYRGSRYGMGWVVSAANTIPTVWHNGDTSTFHAHVMLAPEGRLGVVLLTNGQNELQAARVERITVGAMSLLLGRQPPPPAYEALLIVLLVVLAVCLLQVFGILRSYVLLRRWRAWPELRPRGAARKLLRIGLPFALNMLWALVCLVLAPQEFAAPLGLMARDDVGLIVVASGTVALVWGVLRAVLALVVLRAPDAPKVAVAPATT